MCRGTLIYLKPWWSKASGRSTKFRMNMKTFGGNPHFIATQTRTPKLSASFFRSTAACCELVAVGES
jgi:hypothetical protein